MVLLPFAFLRLVVILVAVVTDRKIPVASLLLSSLSRSRCYSSHCASVVAAVSVVLRLAANSQWK